MKLLIKNNCISFYPINQFKLSPPWCSFRLTIDSVCDYCEFSSLTSFMPDCQTLLKSQSPWKAILITLEPTLFFTGTYASRWTSFVSGVLWFGDCWGKASLGESKYVCLWLISSLNPNPGHQIFRVPFPLSSSLLSKLENNLLFLLAPFKWYYFLLSCSGIFCINSFVS
jgi:hypothetical protein